MQRLLLVLIVASLGPLAPAQIGGNGSDGAFVPDKDTVIDTRWKGGKFNFTKIVIPKGVTVTVIGPNPAFLYSTSTVVVDGVLDASASGQRPGPGGGKGGDPGKDGLGQAGGKAGACSASVGWSHGGGGAHANNGGSSSAFGCRGSGKGGKAYGSYFPIDVSAGSGGGGGSQDRAPSGTGGGGGGFLSVIADGAITVRGSIFADGAEGQKSSSSRIAIGGGGSGGKVMLRSAQVSVVTHPLRITIRARGGGGGTTGSLGFIRIDGYGSAPQIVGCIEPSPRVFQLPDLERLNEPKIGTTMKLRVVSLPDDTILLAGAAKGADINFPPFGKLKLDPGTMFIYGIKKATSGLDGIATFDVPIPNDTRLLGIWIHWQALNMITVSKRPLLTNVLITTVK